MHVQGNFWVSTHLNKAKIPHPEATTLNQEVVMEARSLSTPILIVTQPETS